MITLEQVKEQGRKADDLWRVALIAQREAAKAEEVRRKMMYDYYEQRSENDGIDEGTEVAARPPTA